MVGVRLTNGHNELLLANRNGRAVRFNEDKVRAMGRVATGVIGMQLDGGDDEVVGMVCVNDPVEETIMVVSENGYGKRSEVEDYRKTNRGTKGVKTLAITEKTGRLVAIKVVTDENDLMIINTPTNNKAKTNAKLPGQKDKDAEAKAKDDEKEKQTLAKKKNKSAFAW